MNLESDDEYDGDYGYGGLAQERECWRPRSLSKRELEERARLEKKREAERQVSASFNSYMIALYNQSRR